jgi:hypothetical protein
MVSDSSAPGTKRSLPTVKQAQPGLKHIDDGKPHRDIAAPKGLQTIPKILGYMNIQMQPTTNIHNVLHEKQIKIPTALSNILPRSSHTTDS